MILFADYEGIGVAFSLLIWLVLTVPALIAGLVGVVVGSLRRSRPSRAAGLGLVSWLLELPGVAYVWCCFLAEKGRLGAYAERFRPGYYFWGISILTLCVGSLAIGLGVGRRRTLAAKKNGVSEL
jgi:hypothetical protein